MLSLSSEVHDMSEGGEVLFPLSSIPAPLQPPAATHEIAVSIDDHSDPREGSLGRSSGASAGGVFLTWEDLWVTVSAGNAGSIPILEGLTGYAQPAQLLAVMGPSGSGKTTLLNALAGRLDSNTRQSGQILVNGQMQRLTFGTLAYVTQDNSLMTTLTVREAVYYSALLQLPDVMPSSKKRQRADATIKEMGLQVVMNTRIGRLSGGQTRRVSICIEILTRPKLLFLDEPTSGLDSAAAYHVMKRIACLATEDGRTVITSIHQPNSRMFELFQNLCLLSSGRTVYFGRASIANEFFSMNGFPCPTMMNPSDHYIEIINKDFDQDIEQDLNESLTIEEATNKLVTSYKSSAICEQVGQTIAKMHKMKGEELEKGNQASFITQCVVLTRRSFVNMSRELSYYWLRLAIYISMGLFLGSIFYDIGHSFDSIQARGTMLAYLAAFMPFMAIGGFPSFVEDMKIFGRERLNGHYGVSAFVFGNTFSSTPYLLIISLLPGAITYFLVGLQNGIDHFMFFSLVLFACMILVESLMMVVASLVPNFLMGIVVGAGIQGVMTLSGGFFRLPNDLPKPLWKYPMYYIGFHKYAFEAFYKNEYEGLVFPSNQIGGNSTITGEEILRDTWQMQMDYSKWIDLFILFEMVVFYRVMFFCVIKTTEKMKPIIRIFFSNQAKQMHTIKRNPCSTPTYQL